jgi:hypothetical protein
MQKLKKALKKLAGLGSGAAKAKPAQAAKKAPASKKKTQPVAAAKKTAAKKPAAAPIKKAAAKAAAPTPVKKSAAKAAPIKPAAKAAAAPAKTPAKAPEKPVAKTAEAPVAKKAAPAPAKTDAKQEAKKKKAGEVHEEVHEEPTEAALAKASKARKSDEARTAEMASAAAPEEDEEIVLTDADGRRYCRVKDCDQLANVDSYCRYHYLLFWKNIQNRKKILSEGKLERYVEELTARYPDKFLELLRKDLRSEKDFTSAIQELEIDEGADSEFEDEAQSYLDEVRGMGGGAEPSGREEEDF